MILNELLTKQNVLNAILLKEGSEEVSKDLKVKIVRLRIAYNKIRKQFEEDAQKYVNTLTSGRFAELQSKQEEDRTSEEVQELKELADSINKNYNEFITSKGLEEVEFTRDDHFTDSEFDEIIAINAGNEVTINNTKISAEELMEVFYTLFVFD